MSTLILPDPSLVVLVGAAGSGKSTLAARLFRPVEIVSSDALRAAVSGNEADQSASTVAFGILHRTVDRRLADGEMTVVDATNLKPEYRRPLLTRARAADAPVIAIVLDLPADVVLARNAARVARVVDAAVVERHLAAVRETVDLGQLEAEGFDHVVMLRTPQDVANVSIERRERSRRVAPDGARRREC